MSVAGTDEQRALEDALSKLFARHGASDVRREEIGRVAAGTAPANWQVLVEHGLLVLHLPVQHGGDGATLGDLCVVVERSGHALLAGALVPTLLASALIAQHGTDSQREQWLPGLAAGASAAVCVASEGMVAEPNANGWVLSGASVPVLGCLAAEILVIAAEFGEERHWFVVDTKTDGLTVHAADGVDLTRDVGMIRAESVIVRNEARLDVRPDDVHALASLLFSAEAVGVARWCQETGLEYVRVREQFGRPVGSFQAIKHKCARLFIDVQLMAASVWDAAVAGAEEPEQFRLASAAAAVRCLSAAVDVGLGTVTLLGGIGYTWEHDLHLYWRRAISIAGCLGSHYERASRLASLAHTTTRETGLDLGDEPPGFRQEVASQVARASELHGSDRRRDLARAGLVAPQYNPPYGIGADPQRQLIIGQEFARAGLEQPALSIGDWALPTVLAHGTEEQKERLVPSTLRGELNWCQLFSEPEAGSDLASLRTRADKVDGGWRLSGSKVWTSNADRAHWAICLARTDPSAPKHRGLSYFLVDMSSDGVDVRPLREANGGYLFNEVFLSDVFVPEDCLVGEPGQGWQLARTTLGNERLTLGSPGGAFSALTDVLGQSRRLGSEPPEAAMTTVAHLVARRCALEALGRRGVAERLAGSQPGPSASVLKVEAGWLIADVARAVLDWRGPEALVLDAQTETVAQAYLSTPPHLIGGGTAEIQLNVISELILGLPRG